MKPSRITLLMATMLLIANVMPAQTEIWQESDPYAGFQKSKNGLYYQFFTIGNGVQPQPGELVDVSISCMVNDTTVIFPKIDNTFPIGSSLFPGDLFEGLAMMHVGDSASFIVNIDSTFIKMFNMPEMLEEFKSTDILRFEVRMDDCYSETEYPERYAAKVKKSMEEKISQMKVDYPVETEKAAQQLADYFAKNKIKAKPTASGLYYVKTQDGNGEKPKVGQMVEVHYTGKLLDGTVFDSSIERGEPIFVPIGVGQVIPGWDEGIMMMSKGEKGMLYIPYYLAYGDRETGVIPPFSNLIFEVELINFK